MLTTKTSKAVILLSATVTLGALLIVGVNEPLLRIPPYLAAFLRVVVMAEAAYAVGLMLILVNRIGGVRLDTHDKLSRPAFAWLISYVMLTLFACLQLAGYLRSPELTWRTPLAGVALAIADVSLTYLTGRINGMVARASHGVLKLTITDTSKPGPDIDLTDGGTVIPPVV